MGKIGIDWKILLGQIINFAILLYLLKRFVYTPFLSLLEKRRSKIEQGIRNSEEIERKIKKIKEKEKRILNNAREKAIQIAKAAEEKGRKLSEKIVSEGERERERIIKEAMEEAVRKKEEIRERIEKEAIKTSIVLTEEILKEKLDKEKDKNLIEQILMKFQNEYGRSS